MRNALGFVEMTLLILKLLLAYALGSISGSLVLGRLRQIDIRTMGSGNAGGTNAFRSVGKKFALAVAVIDVAKGAIATGIIPFVPIPGLASSISLSIQAVCCGFAAVLGHCYPVWHGFRGGKGAATAVGVLAVLQPWSLPLMFLTWFLVIGYTGWVGLGTMLAGLSIIPSMLWLEAPREQLLLGIVLALFMIFTHRGNIRKMLNGEEYRFEKARFLKRLF
jgi:glycerol-3-phosphate acyltransferase PlsY